MASSKAAGNDIALLKLSYPKRDKFFAHKAVRLMFKTCAAQIIGVDAVLLCTCIAHIEDAKRYSGPVTFYNDQLLPLLGFGKWDRLDRARRRAIRGGWLHYQPPPSGYRQPGTYWVLAQLPH